MTASEIFEKSFKYFNDHKEELLLKYTGKIIVIYQNKVLGVYGSKMEAYQKVPVEHKIERGTFIIKDCSEDAQKHIRVYHSKYPF